MREIPHIKSAAQCKQILQQLVASRDTRVSAWATHKQTSWILAGLNRACSKISKKSFQETPRDTNLAEATHSFTNRSGIQLHLLVAIKRYE
jgi:hypothetical protein